MGTAPVAFLSKLEPGREVAAGSVRGLGKVLPELLLAGWLTTRKDGRVVQVQLTDAGVAARATSAAAPPAPRPARVKPPGAPKPAKAPAGKAPTAAVRLAALEATVAALAARLAALEGRGPAPVDATALRTALVTAIGDVDAGTRAGGLVPIPAVRAELRRRGVSATDADVTAALEALEHEWLIDLSVAQDPGQVAERAAGIERPGRGLLYYVARR